jgi:single-strand DNA-binding protein
VFNEQLAGVVEKFVKKGSKVYVDGALQTRKWTDKNGQDRYSTEIVLQKFRGEIQLLDKLDRDDAPTPRPAPDNGRDLDDSIPF